MLVKGFLCVDAVSCSVFISILLYGWRYCGINESGFCIRLRLSGAYFSCKFTVDRDDDAGAQKPVSGQEANAGIVKINAAVVIINFFIDFLPFKLAIIPFTIA